MQAFWVRIKDGIELVDFTLNNDMRSQADEIGNKFKVPAVKNQVLRLEVSNSINKDETLLYFNNSASDNFDRFDSPKMFNNSITIPEIYTKIGNEQLVINGMNSYNRETSIPLGFNAGQAGTYTIHTTNIQNFDVNTRIILFDNETQSEFDLTEGKLYEFKSEAVKTDYRFQIRFKFISGSTAIESTLLNDINVHTLNRHIYIQLNSPSFIKTKVSVFNALGHCIYNQTLFQQSTQLEKSFETGLYFIMIDSGEKSLIRKIIVY